VDNKGSEFIKAFIVLVLLWVLQAVSALGSCQEHKVFPSLSPPQRCISQAVQPAFWLLGVQGPTCSRLVVSEVLHARS